MSATEGVKSINISIPTVVPRSTVLDLFWRRVAYLTGRFHDGDRKWIGSDEIKAWNSLNRNPCHKCSTSKSRRVCIVDEDNPNCRTCRNAKISCDRKSKFIFDLTKDEFFPEYDQFLSVYHNREPVGRPDRHDGIVQDIHGATADTRSRQPVDVALPSLCTSGIENIVVVDPDYANAGKHQCVPSKTN
ncbi:hypothetical protein B0H11DRAFT_1337760 [Mycena galericulata]|nr:hypothetical protein B0H11DRAFT_1337760 [Mycena galericulata]